MSKNGLARAINSAVTGFYRGYLREIEQSRVDPVPFQRGVFENLMRHGGDSKFGREHNFRNIKSIEQFQRFVPIVRYDDMVPYFDRLRQGERYVLWDQPVNWFAKSSGTSSAKSKYIPVTPDSIRYTHFGGMKRMLVNYVHLNKESRIFCSRALTLGGSVTPDELRRASKGSSKAFYGDLSAVMLVHSPKIVELLRSPRKSTALIGDFDRKVGMICREASRQNITNFSGVPSWNLILMNKILEYTGKSNLLEVWPNLELFMHGGVGFEHYRPMYEQLIPSPAMQYLENYNASEGYFAFQDYLRPSENQRGMLLTVNNGVFYEFVPFSKLDDALSGDNSCVVPLEGVRTGENYAIIVSTIGGLWRYLLEDCVEFTSTAPPRIIISGRTKLYINAFGEEVMIDNAEKALNQTCKICDCKVSEFTVAPEYMKLGGEADSSGKLQKGYHIWAIEFSDTKDEVPSKDFLENFAEVLDAELRKANSDYDAKRTNNATMQRLRILPVKEGTFVKWMESRGKLGGQNKVPRLWKDKTFIDQLTGI